MKIDKIKIWESAQKIHYILIISFFLSSYLMTVPVVNSMVPHTIYGYAYYGDEIPAENATVSSINFNSSDIIQDVATVRVGGVYYFDIGCPGPCWNDGDRIEVIINGTGEYKNWSGSATLTVNFSAPNQQLPNIYLYPPAPSRPEKPLGPSSGMIDTSYSFSTNATDPNGYNISYGWDWDGDGIVDEWSNWLSSGHTCNMSHSWHEEGTYEVKVKAKNEYNVTGNWSPSFQVKIERDKTPPNTWIIDGPSGIISCNNVTFKWGADDDVTADANLVYAYKLVGYDADWSPWLSVTSKTYYNLSDGYYTFEVKAKDEAGNEDEIPASRSFTIAEDKTAPEVWITEGPNGTIHARGAIFTWSGRDDVTPDNQLLYSYMLENYSSWSKWTRNTTFFYSGIQNGNYTFMVKAKDEAGNICLPAERQFTIDVSSNDTVPPMVEVIYPNGGEEISGNIVIEWNATDLDKNITILIKYSSDNGATWHNLVTLNNTESYEWDTTQVSNGDYIISVSALDSAGNIGSDTSDGAFTIENKKETPGFTIVCLAIAFIFCIYYGINSKKR